MSYSPRSRKHTSPSRGYESEISKLINSNTTDYSVLSKLRQKHGDEKVVQAIFSAYKERTTFIKNKARKFKQLIIDRYSRYNLPFPELLKKAKKWQGKYKLTDDEFQMFVKLAMSEQSAINQRYTLPSTNMSRLLGHGPAMATGEKLNIKENELSVLQDILRIYGETKELHNQIVIQSMMYTDCDFTALAGKYDPNVHKINRFNHVHPVLAALFLPKIDVLDQHMLLANIANIVKNKHEGNPIMTKPEFELFWDLIWDPNDAVCSDNSPLVDLKNRAILQTRLWDCVLHLRQGKYYSDKFSEFMSALELCKNNVYDAPDMAFVKDEGTILRKLLSTFSLRPTMVSTTPVYNAMGGMPTINPGSLTQVTFVSMVTLRAPLKNQGPVAPLDLTTALEQNQWFVENKTLVPKKQSLIFSRDVLFFYVNRRYQHVNVAQLQQPYNFNTLPATVSGFEKLNEHPVNADLNITLLGERYDLRSVVLVDYSAANEGLITGTSAMIRRLPDFKNNIFDDKYIHYNPGMAGKTVVNKNRVTGVTEPLHTVAMDVDSGNHITFMGSIRKRGTIFVYVKEKSTKEVSIPFGVTM